MIDKVRDRCYASDTVKTVLDNAAIEEFIEVNSTRSTGYNPPVVLIEVSARLFKEVRQWSDWNQSMSNDERVARNRKFAAFSTLMFPNPEMIEIFIESSQEVQHHLYKIVGERRSGRELTVYAGCLYRSGISIGAVKEKDEFNWVRDCLKFYEILKETVKDDSKAGNFDLTSPNDFIVDGFASRAIERETWVYHNIRQYARTVILLRLVYSDVIIREFLMKFRDYNTTLDSMLILDILDRWEELREFPSDWIVNMGSSDVSRIIHHK